MSESGTNFGTTNSPHLSARFQTAEGGKCNSYNNRDPLTFIILYITSIISAFWRLSLCLREVKCNKKVVTVLVTLWGEGPFLPAGDGLWG